MKSSRMIRILILVSTLWMVFTIFKTQAAERRPATVEDVVSMKRLADPRISPNGSRVAFVVTETDDEQNINDSDIWLVETDGTPLLIQVGENDERVPKTQSIEFYNALQDLGVPSQLVIYSRQPHGVREPKLVEDLLQRNVDWFNKWLIP